MKKTAELAKMISECKSIVFFGGAGVSTESGVKDYRSRDGLYTTVKEYGVSPEVILSHDFFAREPEVFYDFYRRFFMADAEPNPAHLSLAELERMGKLSAVITQNIDGLHQKAGSRKVIELHGTAKEFYCYKCRKSFPGSESIEQIRAGNVPKCRVCGGVMKPKVVLYGEQLYEGVAENAVSFIDKADMLIVGGTSLAVYPAASFLDYFRGKYLVLINKSETPLDSKADIVINHSIGEVFAETMKLIER